MESGETKRPDTSNSYKFIANDDTTNISNATDGEAYDKGDRGQTNAVKFPDYELVVFRRLTQESLPRFWLLQLISSHWFEKASLFVIIVNCVTMGMFIFQINKI